MHEPFQIHALKLQQHQICLFTVADFQPVSKFQTACSAIPSPLYNPVHLEILRNKVNSLLSYLGLGRGDCLLENSRSCLCSE